MDVISAGIAGTCFGVAAIWRIGRDSPSVLLVAAGLFLGYSAASDLAGLLGWRIEYGSRYWFAAFAACSMFATRHLRGPAAGPGTTPG